MTQECCCSGAGTLLFHRNIHQYHHSFFHLEKACNRSGNCIWLSLRLIDIRGRSHLFHARNNLGSNVFGVCRSFRLRLSRSPRCRSDTCRNPWCSRTVACILRYPRRIRRCRCMIFRLPHLCTLWRTYSGSFLGCSRIYSGRCASVFRIRRYHGIVFHSVCSHHGSCRTCHAG